MLSARSATVFVALLATTLSCDNARPATTANDAGPSVTLADFSDGTWTLRIDRRYVADNTNPVLPAEPLPEQRYQATDPRDYSVIVSMQAIRVEIGTTPWIGERVDADPNQLMFNLTEGAFAGGRFVIWQAAQGLQGELTLYGSGVPIAQSERGVLVPTLQ